MLPGASWRRAAFRVFEASARRQGIYRSAAYTPSQGKCPTGRSLISLHQGVCKHDSGLVVFTDALIGEHLTASVTEVKKGDPV